MRAAILRAWRVGRVLILSAVVVGAGGSAAWVAHSQTQHVSATVPTVAPPQAEKITRLDADRIAVPDVLADRLKLKTAAVAPARAGQFPAFTGCLAVDNNTLQRVHARFAGEVVELGAAEVPAAGSLSTQAVSLVTRPIQVGDTVKAGQLLAVVWSKDLGEKKSELVDAVSKLTADEKVLARLTDLYKQGGTAERSVRDAERAVEADRVAVDRAERTLRAWRLTAAEVAAVRAEADKLSDPAAAKTDPAVWARVEVRAARGGTVLEKNVTVGDLADTATDLFKIADLTRLTVWAHVYEDDLPLLTGLPRPVRWTVSLPARPGITCDGTLDQIAAVIDPNQHTALVSGRVDNSAGELRVGQFVTVTVNRPAHPGELAVPAEAVVEDGRQSVVYVRPDPVRPEYVRRPVTVVRRTPSEIVLAGESGVRPGDRVVTAGALLLREAADALPGVATH